LEDAWFQSDIPRKTSNGHCDIILPAKKL